MCLDVFHTLMFYTVRLLTLYNLSFFCKLQNCNCSIDGSVIGLEDQCDLTTGQCTCKPEFSGRACNECSKGYYGYPYCRKCNCDMRGTAWGNLSISDTVVPCNPIDGQCNCKENVEVCSKNILHLNLILLISSFIF